MLSGISPQTKAHIAGQRWPNAVWQLPTLGWMMLLRMKSGKENPDIVHTCMLFHVLAAAGCYADKAKYKSW